VSSHKGGHGAGLSQPLLVEVRQARNEGNAPLYDIGFMTPDHVPLRAL
jgi:hypothetical protein